MVGWFSQQDYVLPWGKSLACSQPEKPRVRVPAVNELIASDYTIVYLFLVWYLLIAVVVFLTKLSFMSFSIPLEINAIEEYPIIFASVSRFT